MRAILMLHKLWKTVSTDPNFWRERRAEGDLNLGPTAYQPNAIALGQTDAHVCVTYWVDIHMASIA